MGGLKHLQSGRMKTVSGCRTSPRWRHLIGMSACPSPKGDGIVLSPFLGDGVVESPGQWLNGYHDEKNILVWRASIAADFAFGILYSVCSNCSG